MIGRKLFCIVMAGFVSVCLAWVAVAEDGVSGSVTLMLGGRDVSDDAAGYRALNWRSDEGMFGGIENLTLRSGPLALEAHAILDEGEYGLDLRWQTPIENLVLSIGTLNYRKYFSDLGGYYEGFTPDSYRLDEDLDMAIGEAWLRLALEGEDVPVGVALGYKYAYKDGTKSLLEWNSVSQGATRRAIYPATKDIDEETHTITLDLRHDNDEGLIIENNATYEIYKIKTSRSDLVPTSLTGTVEPQGHPVDIDGADHHQLANSFTIEGWLFENVLLSAGYLFVDQKGESDYSMAYAPQHDPGEPVAYSRHAKFYAAEDLGSRVVSHVLSAGAFLQPIKDLSISLGLQTDSTESQVDGDNNLKHGNPPADHHVMVESEIDSLKLRENAEVRYTGLPFSTIYARANLVQDAYDHYEARLDHHHDQELLRLSEAENTSERYRVGLSTRPLACLGLTAYYQMTFNDNDYTHRIDQESAGDAGTGYAGVIDDFATDRDELSIKVSFRAASWLRTSARYQAVRSERELTTVAIGAIPGGEATVYDYVADIVSLSAVVAPVQGLHISATVSKADTQTTVPSVNDPAVLEDYTGDVLSVATRARLACTEATGVAVGYQYSRADNDQVTAGGLPLASKYEAHTVSGSVDQRFGETVSGSLEYRYDSFEDDHYTSAADFTAHAVVAKVTKTF